MGAGQSRAEQIERSRDLPSESRARARESQYERFEIENYDELKQVSTDLNMNPKHLQLYMQNAMRHVHEQNVFEVESRILDAVRAARKHWTERPAESPQSILSALPKATMRIVYGAWDDASRRRVARPDRRVRLYPVKSSFTTKDEPEAAFVTQRDTSVVKVWLRDADDETSEGPWKYLMFGGFGLTVTEHSLVLFSEITSNRWGAHSYPVELSLQNLFFVKLAVMLQIAHRRCKGIGFPRVKRIWRGPLVLNNYAIGTEDRVFVELDVNVTATQHIDQYLRSTLRLSPLLQ
jgi:hypothetical protein